MKIELVGGVSQLAFAFFFILISTSIQGNPLHKETTEKKLILTFNN
jgi:hypothetical protein